MHINKTLFLSIGLLLRYMDRGKDLSVTTYIGALKFKWEDLDGYLDDEWDNDNIDKWFWKIENRNHVIQYLDGLSP